MTDRFQQLVTGFCESTGLGNPDRLMKGDGFELNGITFSIASKAHANPDALLVYADFGAVAPEMEAYAYYQLLRENHLSFPAKGASFTVSSSTGNVVYAEAFDLAATSADKLCDALLDIAVQAKRWRAEFAASHSRKPAAGAKFRHPGLFNMNLQ